MNDHIPPMRRRADLEKIALVTCRSELEKVKAINVELLAALQQFNEIAKAEERDGDDAVWTESWRNAVEDAREAIAKAEQR